MPMAQIVKRTSAAPRSVLSASRRTSKAISRCRWTLREGGLL